MTYDIVCSYRIQHHMYVRCRIKEPAHKHKVQNNVWTRFVKPFHEDSIGKYAVKVQVCPGNRWYDEYLKKEKDVEVLSTNWDPVHAEEHFPNEVVQEAFQSKSKLATVAAPHIESRVAEWIASEYENIPEGALRFLRHSMYVLKNMVPIQDVRKRTEKADMLYDYRNGITTPTERELFLLGQLRDGPCYDAPKSPRKVFGGAPCI